MARRNGPQFLSPISFERNGGPAPARGAPFTWGDGTWIPAFAGREDGEGQHLSPVKQKTGCRYCENKTKYPIVIRIAMAIRTEWQNSTTGSAKNQRVKRQKNPANKVISLLRTKPILGTPFCFKALSVWTGNSQSIVKATSLLDYWPVYHGSMTIATRMVAPQNHPHSGRI